MVQKDEHKSTETKKCRQKADERTAQNERNPGENDD